MASDWEEVKRLAADFQRAQLSSTVQRLSERNCIEIVNKLIEEKLIEVYYTTNGKEYITPDQLLREIKDELLVAGGRIHLSELSRTLDVDYTHIETKSIELSKSEKNIYLILGQLVDRSYLDEIFEDVNEKLQQNGQISVAELSKLYDLPPDFLQQMLRERLGSIVLGQIDPADPKVVFTQAFIARHKSRVKGALIATTKPTHVNNIINRYSLQERIFFSVLEELLGSSQLNGILSGGKTEKTGVFIPDIYAKAQHEWIDNFYKQNYYLEYDALTRLGIGDPKGFIRKRFKNEESIVYLDSCAIGQAIVEQVESGIETAVTTDFWVDVTTLCPSFLTQDDVQQVVQLIFKQSKLLSETATVYCDTIVASNQLLQTLAQPFQDLMVELAEKDRAKGSFILDHLGDSKSSKAQGDTKKDARKEERRKKAVSGKGASGTQGRETKTKSTKKKYMKGKDSDDESDDDTTQGSVRSGEIPFLSVSEIEKVLLKQPILENCPDDLSRELATILQNPLRQKYQEIARSIFMGNSASNSGSRKLHSEVQEKVNGLMGSIHMFNKGIDVFKSDDLREDLHKYLLRTVCSNVVNILVGYIAQENMLSDGIRELTLEMRTKLIGKLPNEIKDIFVRLNATLNGTSLDDYFAALEATLAQEVCDVIIKKLDKKKEKLLISQHTQSLIQQLSEADEPALVLHLAILLIFSKATNLCIHASGKFVPSILNFLNQQGHLDDEIYQLLHYYQGLIVKHMTSMKNVDQTDISEILKMKLQSIKDSALLFRSKVQNG